MKSKMKLSGQLRSYLRWPLILSILMLVMNIGMYFVDVMAGMWLLYLENLNAHEWSEMKEKWRTI